MRRRRATYPSELQELMSVRGDVLLDAVEEDRQSGRQTEQKTDRAEDRQSLLLTELNMYIKTDRVEDR